jgi:hypothetical protein
MRGNETPAVGNKSQDRKYPSVPTHRFSRLPGGRNALSSAIQFSCIVRQDIEKVERCTPVQVHTVSKCILYDYMYYSSFFIFMFYRHKCVVRSFFSTIEILHYTDFNHVVE